ncbi:MAG: hypothetical protein IT233_06915 [Bacteroidia bacterium]|nr:hypothetical protein [Bacteroidia bacterium]
MSFRGQGNIGGSGVSLLLQQLSGLFTGFGKLLTNGTLRFSYTAGRIVFVYGSTCTYSILDGETWKTKGIKSGGT